jgi:hypothetical protein
MGRIFAGGADAVAETYGRFGELTGRDTNAEQKIYDLDVLIENPDLVQAVADAYGYKVEYFSFESNPEAGVEFRLPQLKKKGYKDGYVWIYDPRNSHGSFKGAVEYTRAWRVSHEIAHGVTEKFMQAKYGDSKRYGRLGRELEVDRGVEGKQVKVTERALTLKEAQRAVEWEDVTFRAQRMILEQLGVKISDAQFAQENNINLADATYRVLTGDFGNPGDFGFLPSKSPADIGSVLQMLESAETQLAADQGRAATEGVDLKSWKRTTDAEIADAVNRSRQDGMGQSLFGIDATLTEPRVTLGVRGMSLPRKPRNAIRFRKFRPAESNKGGVKKLVVKPSEVKGDIAIANEFIVDVPLASLYNATKDPKRLRGNKTQAEFETAIMAAGYAGFYQTAADGAAKGSVNLFEAALVAGMQKTVNLVATDKAGPVKTKAPKFSKDNPGGEWLAGKIAQAEKEGRDSRGMPHRFGTVTGNFSSTVLMPIDKAAKIPGMMEEQSKVRERSLEWLKGYMGETGRLPQLREGSEYAPFVQVDADGKAWVNEGNHRIMAAKALGWTHIPVEVRYFNGGESKPGPFNPQTLIEGHEKMAQQPRLPARRSKLSEVMRRWARVNQTTPDPQAAKGALLVMLPSADGTINLATVRPAQSISTKSLNAAALEADRANLEMTLSPISLGKRFAAEVERTREWSILKDAGFRVDRDANVLRRPASIGTMFSVSRGTNHGKGISLTEASNIAQTMRNLFPAAWSQADIIAVESWEKLPAEVRRGVPDAFSKKGDVEAVFYDPGPLERAQIIIVANNVGSRGAAITAVLHEIVGHYGVRGVLGAGYQNYMDSVWRQFEKEAREAAARNGLSEIDSKDEVVRREHRNKAAEEFIAYIAGEVVSGNKPPVAQIGFWESVVRAVRQMLARYGLVDVNARDIAHLINRAQAYARGGVFGVRESLRRDVMLAQNVPDFYSQMMRYAEKKLPNAGTPEQYLEQLKAAQRKGEFKKDEFETAAVEAVLSSTFTLSEIPAEMWHKDDVSAIRKVLVKHREQGTWSPEEGAVLDDYISGAKKPPSVFTKDVEVKKLTKDALLHIIGKHAARVSWQLTETGDSFSRVAGKRLTLNGELLVNDGVSLVKSFQATGDATALNENLKRMLAKGRRGITTMSEASPYANTEGVSIEHLLERFIQPEALPLIIPGAVVAEDAGRLLSEAVTDLHNKLAESYFGRNATILDRDLVMEAAKAELASGAASGTLAEDINAFATEGTSIFYPTSDEIGIPAQYAPIYDALREKLIRNDEIAYERERAERIFALKKISKDENFVPNEASLRATLFGKFFDDHHNKIEPLIPDALIMLAREEHPSIMAIDGAAGVTPEMLFATHATVEKTSIEIRAIPERNRDYIGTSRPEWGGDLRAVRWAVDAVDMETGKMTNSYDPWDLDFVDQMVELFDWSDTVDPHSKSPVSHKWKSYTLSTGLNAYQEWLLIDENPGGRQYRRGHWGKPNAAHMRSGFVIDESSGKLVPIALEIQSDTGQAWQKSGGEPASVSSLVDLLTDSSKLVNRASKPTAHPIANIYPPRQNIKAEGVGKLQESSAIDGALARLFLNQMIGRELGPKGMSPIVDIIRWIDPESSVSLAGVVSGKIKDAYAGSASRSLARFAASLAAAHQSYSLVAEDMRNLYKTIGRGLPDSSLHQAISASQRKRLREDLDNIESALSEWGVSAAEVEGRAGAQRAESLGFTANIIEALSMDDGADSATQAIRDISTFIASALRLNEAVSLVAVTKLNSSGGLKVARTDTLDAVEGSLHLTGRVHDLIDGVQSMLNAFTENLLAGLNGPAAKAEYELFSDLSTTLGQASIRLHESKMKLSTTIDYLSGRKSFISEAPSHADTTSHQLAAIKKLVAQAVEHDMDYVFFAPAEHSMRVAASTGSVIESENTYVKKVSFPYDGWAELMYDYYMNEGSLTGTDALSAEDANIIASVARKMNSAFTSSFDDAEFFMYEVEKLRDSGKGKAEVIDWLKKESGINDVMESKVAQRMFSLPRGEYAFVYYSKGAGLASTNIADLMAFFPLKEDGSLQNVEEVVGQLGFEGASLLREALKDPLVGEIVSMEPGVEMRVNWGNPNTGLFENLDGFIDDGQFVTARGLRYAYNVMLPNTLKKFAKSYGSEVSLRTASPVIGEVGADINDFDSGAYRSALYSWRSDGMPVQPNKHGDLEPPKLMALKVTDKMREEVRTTGFPMFSIKNGRTGNSLFDSFASKVGPFSPGKTLADAWRAVTHRWRDRLTVQTLDTFHGQKAAEEALGLDVDQMGYVSMRLAAGADAVVRAALEYGVPIWKEGATAVDESAGGFLKILAPLSGNANKLRAWELWMIARRAGRLKAEGRERLFDQTEIDEVVAEVDRRGWTAEFEGIASQYADWKSKLLDFAEEAGIINSTTRPLWEHSDHIPFYRALEGDVAGPFSGGAIADVKQQIQRLRGSDKNIGDPLQNIFMNIASLIDASMRNHAARLSIGNLDGSGLVTKHRGFEFSQAAIPLDQLRARLRAQGVNATTMDAAGLRGIEMLTSLHEPSGENVVSFFEDGKRQYYEIHDPLVLTALQGVHPNPWSKMMALLRMPKRIFTQSITLDPVFMGRNWFRDMWHAFALGRDGAIPVVPGYDSVRGAISSLSKDPKMIEMMAGGGAFDSGYVNANDPAGMAKIIRGRLSASGLVTNMVTGKVKTMFEFYRDLSSSIENSHRVMVFEKARKAGKSLKQASYEARDLMDFSMRGAHPLIRFLAETVPFWNARVQGLYRTFRVAGPGAARRAAGLQIAGMLTRGALLTLASVALFFRNKDDERWKELNDYEKNTYYHFFDVFEKGDHYAMPKPFEIGAMFSTIPEIIAEGMLSEDPDAASAAAKQFYHMVAEALNFAPDVQAVMPIAELAMNRDTFRDSPILTDYDKQLMPEDQDHYRMSPAIRYVAHSMPAGAPEALRSPKQLSHLVLGYTGTLGSYAVGIADMIWWRLNEEEAGLPPEKRPDEIPGVRSFVRNQPRKYPRALSTLYDVLEDADKVYNSMRKAEREDLFEREAALEEGNIELIIAREAMDEVRNEIREINKEIREIHLDTKMSPEEKRKHIDELLRIRNEAAESVYEWRPGGKENVRETEVFKKIIEGSEFRGMTKVEQADKLEELGLGKTADLLRSVSLSAREVGALEG